MRRIPVLALLAALAAGCSTAPATTAPTPSTSGTPASDTPADDSGAVTEQRFPDIVDVAVTGSAPTFSFAVTVSSPYDSPERYADAFRVRGEDGTVYGVTELTHDHATEQPFTRSLSGVTLPAGVSSVVVEGRDQANGWGGGTQTVDVTG